MWTEYLTPASLQETLLLLAEKQGKARLVAGATDLMLELERGVRPGIETLIDITRLQGLDQITLSEGDVIHLGPLVTHNAASSSDLLRERAFPLVSAAWQVGAPQIRNRATIAGNLITASPANDTITPLAALGAWVTLATTNATRNVPLSELYTGVRKTVIQPDEMLIDIAFPALSANWRGTFLKLGLRRGQAISLVNAAVIIELDGDLIKSAIITLGAVAPTIIRAPEAESFLSGLRLSDDVIDQAGELAAEAARPIDDIRGSAVYRKAMVKTLVRRGLRSLRDGNWRSQVPEKPVLLWGVQPNSPIYQPSGSRGTIHTTINGRQFTFSGNQDKSLLRLLREDAGLTGTKEGCAEGECGVCTVYLDGKAVMACLVPAPRADGAEIVTIEGLASPPPAHRVDGSISPSGSAKLHPVQRAFIDNGAVQCGYCTPGFIMSAAKLLDERPHPSYDEITQALTGNLCRCTGYYKIIQAVEDAADAGHSGHVP